MIVTIHTVRACLAPRQVCLPLASSALVAAKTKYLVHKIGDTSVIN